MSITEGFDQHDYNIYMNCEGRFQKTAIGEDAVHQNLTLLQNYTDLTSCHLHYKDTSRHLAVNPGEMIDFIE